MRITLLPTFDPCANLAAEEYLLTHSDEEMLLLWRNDKTVVVGRNQNTAAEVDRNFAAANGIRVVRRITGGGAVYHDLDNVNFSFLTAPDEDGQARMERFTRPMAEALRRLGVPAEVSGRNDLTADGRKISGNAQAVVKNRLLHHGTLLFSVSSSILEQVLTVRPEKLRSHAVTSVRSRVTGIKDYLPDMTTEMFIDALIRTLTPDTPPQMFSVPEVDTPILTALTAKYASWDWTYGKDPACRIVRRRACPGGLLELHLDIVHGHIETIAVYGDFMSVRPLDEVYGLLRGMPLDRERIRPALERLSFSEHFGGITRQEFEDCLFG